VPWFKRYREPSVRRYAEAFRKVAENYRELLPADPGDPQTVGGWGTASLIVKT